jgi:GNAT superfamily N-acetyltransferase
VTESTAQLVIAPARLDDPDVVRLVAEVQQEYVRRYGSPDDTVLDPAEFVPPAGLFLLGRLAGEPVVCGGWRAREGGEVGLADGDAEIKRMYTVPRARQRGLARLLLAAVETSARAAGRRRMVLESGTEQPEALALYAAEGYVPVPKFGLYREYENSRCYGKELVR